jgi:tetratricopeptide (TPR) repeat protein
VTDEESVLLQAANAAERAGDFSAAISAWQQLAFITSRPDYLCKFGRMAQKLGRWTDAENALCDALKADKAFWLAMTFLGSLFLRRTDGDPSTNALAAKGWLEQALAIAPSPMSLSFLGQAHDVLGEKEDAKEAFRKAIEIDESYEEAYFNLGLLLADEGQSEEAERLLRKATQLEPNYPEAHGRLGILLQHLGRYSEGEAELRRAIEGDPKDTVAKHYLDSPAGGAGSKRKV